MEWTLNTLWEIIPLPILIGMFIWTFSIFLFSLFLIFILILLNQRSSPLAELVSIKDLSNIETINVKCGFSNDSLSLISDETTRKDIDDTITSFYLKNSKNLKENQKLNSFPTIKLNSYENPQQINTLPQISSTRRSIIKDLTTVSNSFNDQKFHQSIDSLFSKDSLIE